MQHHLRRQLHQCKLHHCVCHRGVHSKCPSELQLQRCGLRQHHVPRLSSGRPTTCMPSRQRLFPRVRRAQLQLGVRANALFPLQIPRF